jgi:chromosome segregation ATPase
MLQRSVSQTEEEEKKAAVAEKNLQTQTQQLMQHIQTVTRERQKIEQEASLNAAQQATATQAVRSINKQTAEVVGQLHKLEMDAANVQNELARIQVDVINTQAHSVQLQDTKRGLNTELKDRDALIEKYQLEIRQRSDEIEKKMLRVDRLNRKYEKLMESAEEPESMGPLEATIRNVKKQIDAIQSESTRLKQEWLKSQTQLVHAAAEADEILERTVELRARSSILSQKKTRLLQEIGINTAEVKRLGGNIQTMHADMSRINGLINRNSSQAMELANTASLLERDFTQELKELEAESMQMEAKLLALKETKAAILDNILETERQIMLWEKKIQLERETQAALDPEEGKGEVQAMEKEIHRMELRHEMLKREQEQLIQEMERAIEKRDAVVLRQRGRSTSASANPARNTASRELTEQALRKRIAATKKQLLQTERELENCNSRIEDRQAQIHQLTADLEAASTEYETLTGNCDGIKGDIDRLISMKQQWATAVAIRTTMAKKIGAVQRGSMGATKEADGLEVEGSLMSAESKLSALADVISVVQRDFGHLGDVLERVKLLAQDHVSIPAQ